jgi:hypothetical protein
MRTVILQVANGLADKIEEFMTNEYGTEKDRLEQGVLFLAKHTIDDMRTHPKNYGERVRTIDGAYVSPQNQLDEYAEDGELTEVGREKEGLENL